MIEKYFNKGKAYFNLRNYWFESIFHIAAKYNSVETILNITSKTFFFEDLIKKNFKGDTPIHTAAKSANYEILEIFLKLCTPNFLRM